MVIKTISPLLQFFFCLLILSFVLFSQGYEASSAWNPYYFDSQAGEYIFKSQEGQMRLLPRFTEKSELLRSIDNYRFGIFEANPKTYFVPRHTDADAVIFIFKGNGTITFALQENKEFFNLGRGDVFKILAGTTFYLSNNDHTEKLQIAFLHKPVNTAGQIRRYIVNSYYRVFSTEVLKAALNTTKDQLDKLFHQQTRSMIIRPTQQQLKALSQHASSPSNKGPFNLLEQRPIFSNIFGRFFQASPNDYKQLQDLDFSVAFVQMKQGSIKLPFYITRATTIALVVEGSGRFEVPFLNLSSGEYERISSSLSLGDVFIVPPGLPFSIVASKNKNLSMVEFAINVQNNRMNFLSGRDDNILKQLDKEAKELTFNVPAEFVDKILNNQRESYFAPRKHQKGQQREEGRGHSLASTVDFVGWF